MDNQKWRSAGPLDQLQRCRGHWSVFALQCPPVLGFNFRKSSGQYSKYRGSSTNGTIRILEHRMTRHNPSASFAANTTHTELSTKFELPCYYRELGRTALQRRHLPAIDAGREPGEMASGAHELVF